jgi:hypothetical protein
MKEEDAKLISVQPIVSYPREAMVGKAYLMTVDLSVSEADADWPFEEEELAIHCFIDATPGFISQPLGDAAILLHRFGGTYGPAEFLLTGAAIGKADIRVSLTSPYGKPLSTIAINDVTVAENEVFESTSAAVSPVKIESIPIRTVVAKSRQREMPSDDQQVEQEQNEKAPTTPKTPATTSKLARRSYPIHLPSSKVVIAIAQIEGPFPNGKQRVVVEGRETLGWRSLADIESRLNKASAILDALATSSLRPHIVVFPEYSLPVQQAVPRLQQHADRHGFIILGGGDMVQQQGSSEILTQSPIFVPGRKNPIWITKNVISKWEDGLVDEPTKQTQHLLTWKADGNKYWISTSLSLDFSLAQKWTRRGGGLFLISMCSPDVISFRGWADTLLRLPGGTATIMCNCVGQSVAGQSGVVAVDATAHPFQTVFELSENREQVAVFEIECRHLSVPTRTRKDMVFPVGARQFYDLDVSSDGTRLRPAATAKTDVSATRGVINPTIFDVLGKKMRIAFLNVLQHAGIEEKVTGQDFEVLAVFGRENLIVTHLGIDRYDMIYDITQTVNWVGLNGSAATAQDLDQIDEDRFPHFRVDRYYKVLGIPVDGASRVAFGSRESSFPTFQDITTIFKLGQQWENEEVSDEDRALFLRNRWILGTTKRGPAEISAVITFKLGPTSFENKFHLLAMFEERLIPHLSQASQVTSVYGGVSSGLEIDYIARVSCDLQSLSSLEQSIHQLALDSRLLLTLESHIIKKRLSTLSLSKAVLVTNIPSGVKRFRDRRIVPYLSHNERVKLVYESESEQSEFIERFRAVDEALDEIKYLHLESNAKLTLLRNLASGILSADYHLLREVHDQLQTRVERTLTRLIQEEISNEDFKLLTSQLNVPAQKPKTQLTFAEKIKITGSYFDNINNQPTFLAVINDLLQTLKVRNALVHNDFERLTIEECVQALVTYCKFISQFGTESEQDRSTPEADDEAELN